MEQIGAPVRVHIIDVGPKNAVNAWIGSARLIETKHSRRRLIRAHVGTVGPQVQQRTVRLSGLPGLPEMTAQVQPKPGRGVVLEFELPPEYDLDGKVARIDLEPGDGLASDDVCWLNLDSSAATRVLVIEAESTRVEELQSGHHLRTALKVLPIGAQGTLHVERRSPTGVLGTSIGRADLVCLVDVPFMPPGNVEALRQRVRAGGGLVIFLGPSIDRDFYNTVLHDRLRPSESLLPVIIGDRVRPGRRPRPDRADPMEPSHLGAPVRPDLWQPVAGRV